MRVLTAAATNLRLFAVIAALIVFACAAFGLAFGLVLTRAGVSANSTAANTIHVCVSRYTGQARFMYPGQAANCNRGEFPLELGSGDGAVDVEARLSALEAQVPACLSDDNGTALFTGCNVQIVSGAGTTDAEPNGVGNLIVGYNENLHSFARTGSHNIVVGKDHGYASYGGLVVGRANQITGVYASASAGTGNVASGDYASVSGGEENTASGDLSSISGGQINFASGSVSSVLGGQDNVAAGVNSTVSGGFGNFAEGDTTSISGGTLNQASGLYASVSGGEENVASGAYASVSGGVLNVASSESANVSGGEMNTASGLRSSVSGGRNNVADGRWTSVSGGQGHAISVEGFPNPDDDWIAGSLVEDS